MTVILEQYSISEIGMIEIRQPVNLVISAREARRRVNSWLCRDVDMMLTSGEPTLVVGQNTRWRVPVIFTAPHVGPVNKVGIVEIDAESGVIDTDPTTVQGIRNAAQRLSQTLPAFKVQELPTEYFADQGQSAISSAPELTIQANGELTITAK